MKSNGASIKVSRINDSMFNGNLIDDLMAAVERAEQKAQSNGALAVESMVGESLLAEPWFASAQANADYDTKLLGVA